MVIGIAVVVAWFVLLVPVAVTWVRLLGVVFGGSGFVPRGEEVGSKHLEAWWGRDAFVCKSLLTHLIWWKIHRAALSRFIGTGTDCYSSQAMPKAFPSGASIAKLTNPIVPTITKILAAALSRWTTSVPGSVASLANGR